MKAPTPTSSLSSQFPRGFGVAAGIALVAWIGIVLFRTLAGPQEGMFWSEVSSDIGAAWVSFMLVIATPLLLRFAGRLNFSRLGHVLIQRRTWLLGGSFLLYAFIMEVGPRGIAYAPDEVGALLQARTFAAGQLTPQVAPDLVETIAQKVLIGDIIQISRATGRYTPTYWPGYALLMAPFAVFHLSWACNAALTVTSLWLLWKLAQRFSGSQEAGAWAALFALSSAQIALGAATYFSMPAHLLFNLLFVYFFIQNTKRGALAAGIVGSFALVLHNPVPHFSFALPWIIWLFVRRRAHFGYLLLGYIPLFLLIGLGWSSHLQSFDPGQLVSATTSTSQSPSTSRFAEVLARVSTVFKAPDSLLLMARGAGLCKLVVWATPGLVALAWLGWLQVRRERKAHPEGSDADYLWLLGVSLVFNFMLYFGVRFDQGHGWGFRYLHQTWLALPLLGAAFIVRQNLQWKRIAAMWCILGIIAVIPLRLVQMRNLFSDALATRPAQPVAPASITFIHEGAERVLWIQNDPFLRSTHWNLRFLSGSQNAIIANRHLQNAKKISSGRWGETWTGQGFTKSATP